MNPRLKFVLNLLAILAGAATVAVGVGIITTAIWPNRPYLGVGVGITVGGAFVYILAAF